MAASIAASIGVGTLPRAPAVADLPAVAAVRSTTQLKLVQVLELLRVLFPPATAYTSSSSSSSSGDEDSDDSRAHSLASSVALGLRLASGDPSEFLRCAAELLEISESEGTAGTRIACPPQLKEIVLAASTAAAPASAAALASRCVCCFVTPSLPSLP